MIRFSELSTDRKVTQAEIRKTLAIANNLPVSKITIIRIT